MKSDKSDRSFYLSLLDFVLAARNNIVTVGNEFGLTTIQTTTILILNDDKPHPMKRLCVLYHCDASNITGIVDGLEKRALVRRVSDPNDRRVKNIQLSAKGKQVQDTMIQRLTSDGEQLASNFTLDERTAFRQFIEKLAALRSERGTSS